MRGRTMRRLHFEYPMRSFADVLFDGPVHLALAPDEKVEGGAFNCAVSRPDVGGSSGRAMALVAALTLLARPRRKRPA